MKYLQLIRKKLLPLLLSVAVIGSQVPVMAGDFDAEETKESIAAVSSGESDEEENISESEVTEITEEADEIEAPSPDSELELSKEGTAEEFSDSKDDTFGDGNSESNISRDALLQRKKNRNSWLLSIICPPIPKPLRLAMILRKFLWEELFPIHLIIMRHSRGM